MFGFGIQFQLQNCLCITWTFFGWINVFLDMDVFKDQSEMTFTVKEGDAAVLNLPEIDSVPLPDVTWQTDEGVLPYAQKYAKSKTNQLIILSADKDDQKPYR